MGLIDGLIELLAPTRCAGCELPGAVLCPACREALARFDPAESCPRCAAPFGALVCTECWERSFAFEAALALGELAHPLARAVVLYKDAGEERLGSELGALLGEAVRAAWPVWADAVAWVPPTPAALARRGFDHAGVLAAGVAASLEVAALPVLARTAARDQRSLGRAARARNAAATLSADGGATRGATRVLVVDDVLTTGATLDAAASALLEAGVGAVRVAVVARTW